MESNTETTQAGETQEYVEIPDASDADLDAFLESASGGEQQVEAQAEPAAEPEEQKKPEELAEEPKQAEPPKQVSREEFEKLQKQIQGQELLIKRRTSEIGELKRQLIQFKAEREQSIEEQWAVDPKQAYKTQRDLERADEALEKLQAEEQSLTNISQSQQLLAAHVGEALDFNAMREALEADGMPPEFVQQFQANPYAAALPETLIQLAKRGAAEKKVKELEGYLYQIVPAFQKLMAAQQKTPGEVAKNISKALQQPAPITAAAGGTGQSGKRPVDFASMNDAELEEFLRNQ